MWLGFGYEDEEQADDWLSETRRRMNERNKTRCRRPRYKKPVRAITDRAKRYRANHPAVKPTGLKVCAFCGSRRNVGVHHHDGDESNNRRSNLFWACKSCNAKEAARMKKAGQGIRVRQYNPKEAGAYTLPAYMKAIEQHAPGAHDAGGKIIHETPPSRRKRFAREIWDLRRAHGTDSVPRTNPRKTKAAAAGKKKATRRKPTRTAISGQKRMRRATRGATKKTAARQRNTLFTAADRREMIELWHTARTAGASTRYERLQWAAKEFRKAHPTVSAKAAYLELDYATRPGHAINRQRNAPPYNVVRTRQSQQEWYETGSGDARKRAKQLRKLGYKVFVENMGTQVTRDGRFKMTLLSVMDPDDNLPEPNPAPKYLDLDHVLPRTHKETGCKPPIKKQNAFGLDRFIGRKPRTTAESWTRAGSARRARALTKAGVPKKLLPAYVTDEWKDLQGLDPSFVQKVMSGLNPGKLSPRIRAGIKKKIRQLRREGTPPAQAVAIAFSEMRAGRLFAKRKVRTARKARQARRGNPNGEDRAGEMYAVFHGRGPSKTVTVSEMAPKDLAALGDLVSLRLGNNDYQIGWTKGERPLLAADPGADQLYIVGGDQTLNDLLQSMGVHTHVDVVDLGEIAQIEYFTQKDFDNFEPIVYYHTFGEEDAKENPRHVRRPRLLYSRRYKKLMLAGGGYRIKRDGIIN